MANIFHHSWINVLFLSCISLPAAPVNGMQFGYHLTGDYDEHAEMVDKNVLFFTRIADLVSKVKKCKKSLKSKNAIEALFEIKNEVESFTGQQIYFENCYDQVIKDLKNSGVKLTKNDVKGI